jgi:hypothetical protein
VAVKTATMTTATMTTATMTTATMKIAAAAVRRALLAAPPICARENGPKPALCHAPHGIPCRVGYRSGGDHAKWDSMLSGIPC